MSDFSFVLFRMPNNSDDNIDRFMLLPEANLASSRIQLGQRN